MKLDAYLERLGIARPEAPTLDALRALHVAHLQAFPFHNLTIQRGRAVTVDVDSILARFLENGGGGYCSSRTRSSAPPCASWASPSPRCSAASARRSDAR